MREGVFNMNNKQFLNQYDAYLAANFSQDRALKEKQYLYSDLKHFGLSVPQRERFLKEHKEFLVNLARKELMELVNKLWRQKVFEKRSLALELLKINKEKLVFKDMDLVEKLMRESRGWALLDNLIIPLMPYFLTLDKKGFNYLKTWIKDKDFWVRRSALLAQLLFFRAGKGGDKNLFFKLAQSQLDESWIDKQYKDKLENKRAKFFIRKAIGWTLRDMSLKDPEAVVNFLQKNKHRLSGLSFREGSRKLHFKYLKLLKK